jgi:hypothetical protein
MLKNCERYVTELCRGGGPWKSYAELEAENADLRRQLGEAKNPTVPTAPPAPNEDFGATAREMLSAMKIPVEFYTPFLTTRLGVAGFRDIDDVAEFCWEVNSRFAESATARFSCHYCKRPATSVLVWLKDKNRLPARICLPWCGCDLMTALKKFWPNPYQVKDGVDYEIAPLRTKTEIIVARGTVVGCCNRHADNQSCNCLRNTLDDLPAK